MTLTNQKGRSIVKNLLDEMLIRFPEAKEEILADYELPYLAMGNLVDWLNSVGRNSYEPQLIQRVIDFANWCELQPGIETASDDIYTVLVVAFYERLFLLENTKSLIRHLLSKADLERDREYFIQWVGRDNFDQTLKYY
jgi:hypothetical protein